MLAKALYKDAPILVLDEPTAALDPIAENRIYLQYLEMTKSKTSLFISHCRFCDKIAVFDAGGKIVQTGSHKALLADEAGIYHTLWHAQYYTTDAAKA